MLGLSKPCDLSLYAQIRDEEASVIAESSFKLAPTPHPQPAELSNLEDEALALNFIYYSGIVVILAVLVLAIIVSSLTLWWMR